MAKLLTKSKYLIGLQCPKALWIMFNEPEKIPEVDAATQHLFDQGQLVGNLAKKWFPKGIDIEAEDFMENINKTKELLNERKPLFEAGIMVNGLFSRADILNPIGEDEWDIIEVKSSTSVKEVNHHDVSFQKYCYEQAGLKIRKSFLMHINNQYVRKGEIDYKELFCMTEITDEVALVSEGIQERIDTMFKIIASKTSPNVSISKNCNDPYACALTEECWGDIQKGSVFDLIRGGKKSFQLFDSGIVKIKDIPGDFKLTSSQNIQRECELNGNCYVDDKEIKNFLDNLEYPLYYLDFETYNTAVPLFDGIKPYQQVPFQFSLHIQESEGSKLIHQEFLFDGTEDPRPSFTEALKKTLGDKGSIITYNQSFEIGRLKECAERLPEYAEWVESIISRIVDLIIPFRKFHYYNPVQRGSSSIKKVLPALTGNGYDGMEIANGGDASLEFLRITFGAADGTKATLEDIKNVRKHLLKYCGLDTEGMVWIIDELYKMVK